MSKIILNEKLFCEKVIEIEDLPSGIHKGQTVMRIATHEKWDIMKILSICYCKINEAKKVNTFRIMSEVNL